MSTQTNTISSEQETFLLECLQRIRPMVVRLTRGVDVEDAIQEAAIIIMQNLPKVPAGHLNPVAYMSRIVKQRLIDLYRHNRLVTISAISLDKPVGDGQETTLADLLPSPTITDEHARLEALYEALHRLPSEEQRYLRRKYELYSFRVQPLQGRKMNRQRSSLSLAIAYRHLRNDQRLRQSILPVTPA